LQSQLYYIILHASVYQVNPCCAKYWEEKQIAVINTILYNIIFRHYNMHEMCSCGAYTS